MANLFEDALAAEGITGRLADVARSIYQQESGGGKNTKTSNAGARGGMQIIPSTFSSVADKGWDINDPLHNARAGIRYVGQMYKQAGGDPALTAAGYYGGPGGLEKARKGIAVSDPRNPNAPTTLQYGQQVASRLTPSPQAQDAPVPVQVAAVPTPTTVAYRDVAPPAPNNGPIPIGYTAPDTSGWAEMQQAMPQQQPVRVADLSYGADRPMVSTRSIQPNFQAFGKWKARV